MKILQVTSSDTWDDFVWSSINGTIFHTLKFLDYHPAGRFDFINLAVMDGDELVGVIPGGRSLEGGLRVFRSPLGASFGGIVLNDLSLQKVYGVVDALNSWLASQGFLRAELVLPPACYWRRWDESLEFALHATGYGLVSVEATAVVDLTSFDRENLKPAFLRNLRRSQTSGITVRRSQDPKDFYGILERNLASKKAKPTHSLDEIGRLMELFPDEIVLHEALFDGKVVGGSLIFRCNETCALAFYICDDSQYRKFRVTDRVLFECVNWLRGLGHRYFDLGTVSMGGDVNWGLVQFKSKLADLTFARKRYATRFGG